MKNKKIILSIVASIALIVLIIGATYAYFQAQTGEGAQTDIKINASTVDTLTFETGSAISLSLDQDNFASGKGNQSGTTFAKAMLSANNKTNTATEHYNLYLSVDTNTFNYTQDTNTPEILLSIKDGSNNEITSVSGLTYKTVTDASGATIKGFDITTSIGLITLFNNKEITANPQKTDTWNVTVTFINYDKDQSKNAGKSFNAKIIIKKGEYKPSIAEYCSNNENLKDCIVKFGSLGYEATNIAIHNKELVNGAGDNSYRYAGGDAHPDYYSCKYNGNDVYNSKNEIDASSKGDCSTVTKVSENNILFMDKSFNNIFSTKKNVSWDNNSKKCLTSSGEEVTQSTSGEVNEATCTGYAYLSEGEWGIGLTVQELGAGEETLYSPANEENNTPAYYSCNYHGEKVRNSNFETNKTLQGDCSKIFGIFSPRMIEYYDKSVNKVVTDKKAVRWDSINNKCVTLQGEQVYYIEGGAHQSHCFGDAYLYKNQWFVGLTVEEVGSGEETLYNPAIPEDIRNYVCFGSNAATCPIDNLYRIIGVIDDKVKLIKYDYTTSTLLGTDGDYYGSEEPDTYYYKGILSRIDMYYWNYKAAKSPSNTWRTSLLNKTNLNTNYLNNIGMTWSNLIEDTTWKVSGHSTSSVTPSEMYTAEITNATKTYGPSDGASKIGLMYASDYGFAASPSSWSTTLNNYNNIKDNNWMHMGLIEWTMLPSSSSDYSVFYLNSDGNVVNNYSERIGYVSRPVFYLKSSVLYAGGSGTKDSPITLVL